MLTDTIPDDLNLRHLQYFVVLAQEGHVGRAAIRIGIKPSSLSSSIRRLEETLKVRLLARTTRSVRLTERGALFLQDARRILGAIERAGRDVARPGTIPAQRYRIGVCPGIAYPRLVRLLERWGASEPDVEISIMETSYERHVRDLQLGSLDASLAAGDSQGQFADGIEAEAVWRDPYVVLLRADHRLAEHADLALADLAREPLIVFAPAWSGLQRGAQTQAARLNVRDHVSSLDLLFALILARRGIGLASALQAEATVASDLVVRPLATLPGVVSTLALYRVDDLPKTLSRFFQLAQRITATSGNPSGD